TKWALTVNYSPENQIPVIGISQPIGQGVVITTQPTVAFNGTASDNDQIAAITWVNQTSGSNGTATGKTSWSAQVPLVVGSNSLVFRAYDRAGNFTDVSAVIISDPTAPEKPTAVAALGVDTSHIRVTWYPVNDSGGSGLSGYRVYRDGILK